MSLLKDEKYYKEKAYKYYTKYTELKQRMKGGAKPDWYDELVQETKLIYDNLTRQSASCGEPKNTIILSGSAAMALLLGYVNADTVFPKPNDLDFIYQGATQFDNHNIPSITIQYQNSMSLSIPITYNRKQGAISSPEYNIDNDNNMMLIKKIDLTNLNERTKENEFTKLPYINIYGINVITPIKLLSFYNDDFLEKNINKIEILTKFIDKINSDMELKKKYTPILQDNKYIPAVNIRSRLRLDDDEPDAKRPPKLTF